MADSTPPVLLRLGVDRLSEVVAVERLGQAYPWSERQLADALTDPEASLWGAQATSGELLGFAVLCRLPFDAELQAITVSPSMRRRGIAGRLMARLIEEAGQWGSERLLLEVRAGNGGAIALYRRYGFGEDGRRRGYYPVRGERREDALLMSRSLS